MPPLTRWNGRFPRATLATLTAAKGTDTRSRTVARSLPLQFNNVTAAPCADNRTGVSTMLASTVAGACTRATVTGSRICARMRASNPAGGCWNVPQFADFA